MVNILLVSHGSFASSVVETSKMICGEQENVKTLSLQPDADLDEFKNSVENYIKDKLNRSDKLIVLTDLMYGTPFNVVTTLMDKYDFKHFSGMNLPLFLELVVTRFHVPFDELVKVMKELGPATVVYVNELVGGN